MCPEETCFIKADNSVKTPNLPVATGMQTVQLASFFFFFPLDEKRGGDEVVWGCQIFSFQRICQTTDSYMQFQMSELSSQLR